MSELAVQLRERLQGGEDGAAVIQLESELVKRAAEACDELQQVIATAVVSMVGRTVAYDIRLIGETRGKAGEPALTREKKRTLAPTRDAAQRCAKRARARRFWSLGRCEERETAANTSTISRR